MARRPAAAPEAPPPEPDRIEGAPHPRRTARLFGQQAAERAFLDQWRGGRLPHAWLLGGPRGTGKATLAWRIARALIAQPAPGGLFGGAPEIPDTLDMDPENPVFRRVAALSEGRLKLLRRGWDDRRRRLHTRITAEDARDLRLLFERSAPDGGWRVAIVDCVDDMTVQAANALLKLIEEPPERSMFLLVAHAPARVLPTIRSRCRPLALRPLGEADLLAAVAAAQQAPRAEDRAEDGEEGAPPAPPTPELAALAEGSAGEALRLAALDGPALYAGLVAMAAQAPGMDRAAWAEWMARASGAAGEARLDATLRLTEILLARLARAAASGRAPAPAAAPGEAALMARLAARPDQARAWAEAARSIPARAARARAVNLDPGGIILDTFAALDAAAARALAA